MDERVAPPGRPDRNLTHLRECLLAGAALTPSLLHAMPMEEADLPAAAARYAAELHTVAGSPPEVDLVHLGLGPDGHAASLVPAPVLPRFASGDPSIPAGRVGADRALLLADAAAAAALPSPR